MIYSLECMPKKYFPHSAKKTPRVATIILNYNVWEATLKCVESVQRSTYPHLAIVVIDNNSQDASAEELRRRLPADVTFIAHDKNIGYAGGNNLGITWAFKHGAEYVFILNPDTMVDSTAIAQLVLFAENPRLYGMDFSGKGRKGIGFLGPRIFHTDDPNDPTIYSDGGIIHWTLTRATLRHNGLKRSELTLSTKPFACDYITGTALFASKRVLKDVGLLREEYFLYYEDTDWSIRCRRKGYSLLVVPAATVFHVGYQSTGLLSPRYIYYHTRNALLLAFWNGGLLIRLLAYVISAIILLKQPLKWVLYPQRRPWVRPVIRGVLDAWRKKTGPANI